MVQMGKPKSKTTYVKVPQAEGELLHRLQILIEVLAGQRTVSDGARVLGLSRNYFQTLKNASLEAILDVLMPAPSGRPRKDTEVSRLQEELEELEEDNAALQREIQTQSRIIDNLTDMVRERSVSTRTSTGARKRRRSTKKKVTKGRSSDDDDRPSRLSKASAMRRRGMRQRDAARAIGCSPATLRRWQRRELVGLVLASRPGPGPKALPSADVTERARAHVRRLRGLVGADALRRLVPDLTRRQAAALKAEVLTEIESRRKRTCRHVDVTRPGVVRGFDAMHLVDEKTRAYALVACDAAVPYRTSVVRVSSYDGVTVADVLARDFEQHGPPLVLRLDRASCHKTREVDHVLDHYGVLRLHGPAHHPGYYGQLERQNREHRAWQRAALDGDDDSFEHMCFVLNELRPRRSLDWRTSAQCWNARPKIDDDRDQLRDQVHEHAQRLQRKRIPPDLAQRLAIERALIQRGYLHIQPGGRC